MDTPEERKMPLEEVARRLDEAGVPWAVFAGAAASVYGVKRPITDIDILVPAAAGDQIAQLFPEAQIETRHGGAIWALQLPGGYDIVAGLRFLELDAQMIGRLRRREIAGVSVPVIPPEDNIVLKAVAGRGPEQGKRDWEDVAEMMATLPELDRDYLLWRLRRSAPEERIREVRGRLEALGL
jgi:hypothetical protein